MRSMCLPFGLLLAWAACSSPALAERRPEGRNEAVHVITGRVEKVTRHDGGDENSYVVRIRVESVQKGRGYRPGGAFYATCFQRKLSAPEVPSASGHSRVPRKGQRIRAYVKGASDNREGIYPDWFDVLKSRRQAFRR